MLSTAKNNKCKVHAIIHVIQTWNFIAIMEVTKKVLFLWNCPYHTTPQ